MRGVAQLASSWNLPVFGWISSDIDLSDKVTFSTLVRLQGPLDTIVTTMRYISRMFKWYRFALIYDHQSRYEAVEKAILSGQEKAGYYMTSSHKVSILSSDDEVKNIFKQIRKYARIIIFAVPWMDMRKYMLIAHQLDMAGGDFVFLCMHSDVYIGKRFSEEVVSDRGWRRGDKDDKKARVAFESVLHIINPTLSKEVYQNYQKRISELDYKNEDWNLPAITSVDAYTPFLFDATMVWAFLANKTIAKNIDPKNGSHIFEEAKYFESDGLTQAIALDVKGDRLSNIWILDMVAEGQFQVVMEIYNQATGGKLTTGRNQSGDVRWGSGKYGRENAPRDEPVCGFEGDLCPENKQMNIRVFFPVVMTASVAVGLILLGFACHRSFYLKRVRNERPAWKVDPEEIMFKQNLDEGNIRASFMSLGRRRSSKKNPSRKQKNALDNYGLDIKECSVDGVGQPETVDQTTSKPEELIPYPPMEGVYCNAAIIRGGLVYAKKITEAAITFNEGEQHQLAELVEIKHSNIAMFVGACIGPGPAYIFWEYCSKGSLRDIIKNINIRLDDMFKFALCQDIAKGLDFLHKSEVREHGNLKSCNCVVDSRWTCKLVDFGLRFLKHNKPIEERIGQTPSELYWTAPEVLRGLTTGYRVKADMYAFGVIIKEVFTRKSPYQEYSLSASEMISRVKNGPKLDTEMFRPWTDIIRDCRSENEGSIEDGFSNATNCPVKDPEDAPACYYTNVFQLARGCWAEDPSNRPTAGRVYKALLRLNPNRNLSMIDNMVGLLETYANHLEDLVVDRTEALNVEKSKVETLLFKLLPKEVAQTLKSGKDVKAEFFEESSIYFSDIVGFTKICAQSSPIEVVNLLNRLYQTFDNLIEKFDVYKVETIGDAYMIASGVPKRNGKQHIKEIVDCAIDLLNSISRVKIPHMPGRHLKIRIGIHSGAVVGGVVGNKMPRYCLFGDTVNVASRMESTGVPMCIHMSSFAKAALDAFPGYVTECRGEIEVKGKGLMTTYLLIGSQECRVVAYDDNDNETLQESLQDPISKMTAYNMNQELMYLLSLKEDKGGPESETPVHTRDVDSVEIRGSGGGGGGGGGDSGQWFSSMQQTNERRHPKSSTDIKCSNSVVTFGGCSLIVNKNYHDNPEMLTNAMNDRRDKRLKSKVAIHPEMPVSSILKNGSQQRKKEESIATGRAKCPKTIYPETKCPETKYPETICPETKCPETKFPMAINPDTKCPDTKHIKTIYPETKCPETKCPMAINPDTKCLKTIYPVTKCPMTGANLEIDNNGSAGGFRVTNICTALVNDQVCKNGAKNRTADDVGDVQNTQQFPDWEREHSYDAKELCAKPLHPQQQSPFHLNHNVSCFVQQNPTTIDCGSRQIEINSNKQKPQPNQIHSLDKIGPNHDVAINCANNLKNCNEFANSLMAIPSGQQLDSSPTSTRKVDFASVDKCWNSTAPKEKTNSRIPTPITDIRKRMDSPDGIVPLTNLNNSNKTGFGSVQDGLMIPVVTCRSHLWGGTDEDRPVVVNMANINYEMTSL